MDQVGVGADDFAVDGDGGVNGGDLEVEVAGNSVGTSTTLDHLGFCATSVPARRPRTQDDGGTDAIPGRLALRGSGSDPTRGLFPLQVEIDFRCLILKIRSRACAGLEAVALRPDFLAEELGHEVAEVFRVRSGSRGT